MNRYNNSKTRSDLRIQLISERGKVCQNCGCTKSKKGLEFAKMSDSKLANYLILHEKDLDKKNLDPANLLLLCKSCNFRLEHSRPLNRFEKKILSLNYIRTNSRQYKQNEILDYGTEGMRRNVIGQKALRDWLNDKLEENTFLEVSYVINNGAAIAGVTITTIEKVWLPSMTSESDDYEVFRDNLYIKKRKSALEAKFAS